MAENIFLTNGQLLLTLTDTSINSNVGLNLIGRNAINYGNPQNENFVHLLENFASPTSPDLSSALALTPLTGTLWWNTSTDTGAVPGGPRLQAYDGLNWIPVSERTVSNTAPGTYKLGDQWWDNINKQLKSWSGSDWRLVGPGYTESQQRSGTFVEVINDGTFSQAPHLALVTYIGNVRSSITSLDPAAYPAPADYTTFGTIIPGINLASGSAFNGTSSNTLLLNGVEPQRFARNDIKTIFQNELEVTANLSINGKANIFQAASSPHLTIQNTDFRGHVDFFINSPSGNVNVLHMDGVTGLVRVAANPQEPLDVSTKQYVDALISSVNSNVSALAGTTSSGAGAITADYTAKINALALSTYSNSVVTQSATTAAIAAVQLDVDATNINWQANAAFQETVLNSLLGTVATLAPINNPVLTGTPSISSTPAAGDDSLAIPSTAYVDRATNTLQADYLARFTSQSIATTGAIASAVAPLAPLNNPSFTGTPTYNTALGVQPTPVTWSRSVATPISGDNSGKLASTAFVVSAITGQKFNYTVSTNPPTGGVDGDVWFQVQA
jgi:hypothetical protein